MSQSSAAETLAQAIARVGSPVELLRNQDWPSVTFPIQPEFTNWRDEQRAWSTSVAIMDQSHRARMLTLRLRPKPTASVRGSRSVPARYSRSSRRARPTLAG